MIYLDINNINTDRDTTGLGPIEYNQSKVPQLIRKYANNVRTKTYGQDVREAQARNAEVAGLIANEAVDISNENKGRQDDIETQFNSVQQELTDKDVISAPEIIAARNNFETLGARLDSENERIEKANLANYEQEDFIETLLKYQSIKKMWVVANNFANKNLSFIYELDNGKAIRYLLSKNGDGFAILKAGQIGDFNSETKAFTNPVNYMADASNKEFAFNLKESGSSEAPYFIPMHNQQATAFDRSDTKHILDGVEISNTDLPNGVHKEVTDKYTVIQYVVFYKPNTTTEIGRATVHMVFNSNGRVDINTTFTATLDLTINYGYVNMLPVSSSFGKKMLTSYGSEYPTTATDGTRTNLTEKDLANSYVFINDSPTNNIAVAMTMQRPKLTMRVGKSGRPNLAPVWIEHRSAEMQKLYPMPFSNAEMNAGEVYGFGGSYMVASVYGVNDILGGYA